MSDKQSLCVMYPCPKHIQDHFRRTGLTDQEDMHVTVYEHGGVSWGEYETFVEKLRLVLANRAPLTIKIGGQGLFYNEKRECIKIALIDCVGLDMVRAITCQVGMNVGLLPKPEHGFTPHMTIGKEDHFPTQYDLRFAKQFSGTSWKGTELLVHWGYPNIRTEKILIQGK